MVRIEGPIYEPECNQLERGARQGGIEHVRVELYEGAAFEASCGNKRWSIRLIRSSSNNPKSHPASHNSVYN